jgi:hypothetical protein
MSFRNNIKGQWFSSTLGPQIAGSSTLGINRTDLELRYRFLAEITNI